MAVVAVNWQGGGGGGGKQGGVNGVYKTKIIKIEKWNVTFMKPIKATALNKKCDNFEKNL